MYTARTRDWVIAPSLAAHCWVLSPLGSLTAGAPPPPPPPPPGGGGGGGGPPGGGGGGGGGGGEGSRVLSPEGRAGCVRGLGEEASGEEDIALACGEYAARVEGGSRSLVR